MLKQNAVNKGFTLIELLVVVLIIGVLAAIAWPQYQFALDKARISAYIPAWKSVIQAQEMYYLTQGNYAKRFADLELDIHHVCPKMGGLAKGNELLGCLHGFHFDNSAADDTLMLDYCPGAETLDGNKCRRSPQAILGLWYSYQHAATNAGVFKCRSYNARGERLCRWLTPLLSTK